MLKYSWPKGQEGHRNGGREPPLLTFLWNVSIKGGCDMVTYEALQAMFTFAMLIVTVIALVLGNKDK